MTVNSCFECRYLKYRSMYADKIYECKNPKQKTFKAVWWWMDMSCGIGKRRRFERKMNDSRSEEK